MINTSEHRVGFLRRSVLPLALVATACGVLSAEAQLLMDFFQAARLGDRTMLAKVSIIGLNPRTEGAVQYFEIVAMGEEQRHGLRPGGGLAARNPPDIRADVAAEGSDDASLAISSLTPRGQPAIDVTSRDVQLVAKPVTVLAQVNTPDGRTVPRTLVFTLQRAVETRGSSTIAGRWIITGLQLTN